jgi:hypothetical protein
MNTIEELLGRKSSGSGLQNRDCGSRGSEALTTQMRVCPVVVAHKRTHNYSTSCVLIYPLLRITVRAQHVSCVGPDVWPLEYPECSRKRQSPIDLEVDDMYLLEMSDQLRWQGYRTRPQDLTLTNNRHTSTLFMRHKMTFLVSASIRSR